MKGGCSVRVTIEEENVRVVSKIEERKGLWCCVRKKEERGCGAV